MSSNHGIHSTASTQTLRLIPAKKRKSASLPVHKPMSFGSSKSTRLVRQKTKQPGSPSRLRDRPSSPNEAKNALEKKKRIKSLGLNYLRSTNRQAKFPKVATARSVMESIKKVAQKSGGGVNLKKIFNRLDLDGNGVLDRQEFRKALSSIGIKLSIEEATLIFETYDPNNTGGIDYEEFLYSFFNRRKLVTASRPSSSSEEILEPANVDDSKETIPEKRWNAWNKVKEHVLHSKDLSVSNSDIRFDKNVAIVEQPATGTRNSGSVHSRHWDAVRKHVRRHSAAKSPNATTHKEVDGEAQLLSPLNNSLKHIMDLKNKGVLSDIEFKRAKAKLLGTMPEAVELDSEENENEELVVPSPASSLQGGKELESLKDKLATTQKQLRRAFIENAEMSRTIQKLKLQGTTSNIGQIPNVGNYGDKSSVQRIEAKSTNHDEPAIANALRKDDPSSSLPPENGKALSNAKHTVVVGFADIGPNHQQRLSMIRLNNGCIVIRAVCNFGRCDIFPKLIRSHNIGVLDVAKNVVNMVVRPTNELFKITFRGPNEAAAFAHNLHTFIQKNERKLERDEVRSRNDI